MWFELPFRQFPALDLDRDNLLDDDRTNDLRRQGAAQQVPTDRVGKQCHDVVVVKFEHHQEQQRRQTQQHRTTHSTFARQRLDLAEDLETFTNQVANLVKNFSQVTTGLTLQHDRRRKEPEVHVGDPVRHVFDGFVQRNSEVLFLKAARKFRRQRRLSFRSNQTEPGVE